MEGADKSLHPRFVFIKNARRGIWSLPCAFLVLILLSRITLCFYHRDIGIVAFL